MGRIEQAFTGKRRREGTAFVAYITAGDPSLAATAALVREFARRGVDIVELGVPFSDPVADGPVNQDAAMRALAAGTTLEGIIDTVRDIRTDCDLPIVFFAYVNTILSYGLERFARDASDAGVDGVLVLDLPPEEADEYKKYMDGHGISTIFLVSPVTPPDRIEKIVRYATGFVYYVSQMGVTGERDRTAADLSDRIRLIRSMTDVPVAVGFGISSPDQVRSVADAADGVVVGSAIVRRIAALGDRPDLAAEVGAFVETLTAPVKGKASG